MQPAPATFDGQSIWFSHPTVAHPHTHRKIQNTHHCCCVPNYRRHQTLPHGSDTRIATEGRSGGCRSSPDAELGSVQTRATRREPPGTMATGGRSMTRREGDAHNDDDSECGDSGDRSRRQISGDPAALAAAAASGRATENYLQCRHSSPDSGSSSGEVQGAVGASVIRTRGARPTVSGKQKHSSEASDQKDDH